MSKGLRWTPMIMAGCIANIVTTVSSAAFPDRPVHLLIGFQAGSGTDSLARLIGQKLSEKWGQPVIVENKPGADGTIADDLVAHAAPDGYNLVFVTPNHTVIPNVRKLNFDAIDSFAAITMVGTHGQALVVNPTLIPSHTTSELIAFLKSNPRKLNYSSSGPGSPPFLAMELFKKQAGVDLVGINYKGGAPAILALEEGEVQVAFGSVPDVAPIVASGKLRALAVDSLSPDPIMPKVPTVEESAGLPGFHVGSWYGILATAGTPTNVVNKLHDDIISVLNLPDVEQAFSKLGMSVVSDTPAQFTQMMREDIVKWADLLKSLKLD